MNYLYLMYIRLLSLKMEVFKGEVCKNIFIHLIILIFEYSLFNWYYHSIIMHRVSMFYSKLKVLYVFIKNKNQKL